MMYKKGSALLKKYWIYYLFGTALILGIKYFYSRAGADELRWVLAPTAWWVKRLSGIPFGFEPEVGYINYEYRFIIAASCSGVQFMTVSIAALIFSFIHRMNTIKKGLAWTAFSLGISYLFTILVNSLRIIASIFLPLYVSRQGFYTGLLTPERLHTLIGIAIYFTSLFTLYQAAEWISRNISLKPETWGERIPPKTPQSSWSGFYWKCIMPMFWYFAIVIGIPFLNRAYLHDGRIFIEYAALMTAVCLTITGLYCLSTAAVRWLGRHRTG